jgi:saccharopine dehydrogenase (NADP+, L-glutamate forming)
VGVTCGIADTASDSHPALNKKGVLVPYHKEICDPIRELVEKEGIRLVEEAVQKP